MDDTFGKPDKAGGADPSEGVRIIGAEEAAEAMQRGDVASRRGGDEPRYGDRPTRPPVGPRPVLRFPLDANADPTQIDRPTPRPPNPADGPTGASLAGRGQRFDPQLESSKEPMPSAAMAEPAADAYGDTAPELRGASSSDDPTLEEPMAEPTDDPSDGTETRDVGPGEPSSTESVEMPHWREPPTGEVPKVIAGEGGDDLDAWSSFTSSAPRWRDSEPEYHDDGFHEALSEGADWRVGAMDDSRPTHEEIYSFDEVTASPAVGQATPNDGEADDPDSHDEDRDTAAKPRRSRLARRRPPPRNPVAEYASGGSAVAASPGRKTSSGPPAGGKGAGRNVPTAVIVGVGLGVLALFLFGLGPRYAMVMVVGVVVVAAAEYFNAVRRAGYQPAVLLGLVASAAFPLAVYWKGIAAYPVLGVVVVMAGLLWHLVGADGDARVVESTGVTLLGVAWIGGLASFAALMLTLDDGVGILIAAVIATVAYDVGGFAIGRNAGTRPLSEASPNKTWEGLVGGMVTAVFVTTFGLSLVLRLDPFDTFGDALIVGLAAAAAAPLGDLSESLVKRDLGIKDMGSVLPGHGGVLDRFDAMLFVLPAVFYAAAFFELGPFG